MPQGQPIPAYEVQEILARFRQHKAMGKGTMEACELIGKTHGRAHTTIWAVIKRLTPTTGLAADYIKAQAYRLAHKIVKEGSVEQAIDVLSRPNIGVLEPIKKGEIGGGGFYLSVQSDSCGAVKVGVAMPGNNPTQIQGVVHEQEVLDDPLPSHTGDGDAYFGRITRRALAEGGIGKGNAYKRGDGRRPNRGTGVRSSKKGADEPTEQPQGKGIGLLSRESVK